MRNIIAFVIAFFVILGIIYVVSISTVDFEREQTGDLCCICKTDFFSGQETEEVLVEFPVLSINECNAAFCLDNMPSAVNEKIAAGELDPEGSPISFELYYFGSCYLD